MACLRKSISVLMAACQPAQHTLLQIARSVCPAQMRDSSDKEDIQDLSPRRWSGMPATAADRKTWRPDPQPKQPKHNLVHYYTTLY